LESGHEGSHKDENDETWIGTFDSIGMEMVYELNNFFKTKGIAQFILTPSICKALGKVFEDVAEAVEYHHYTECDHSTCQEIREPVRDESRD